MRTKIILLRLMLVTATPALAQQQTPAQIPGYRDPGKATLYSVALPGGGQFYSGDTGRGLLLLGGSSAAILAGTALSSEANCNYDASSLFGLACKEANRTPLTIGMLASIGIWGYGVLDAKKSAERNNARRARTARSERQAEPLVIVGARSLGVGTQIRF